jgi:hypothetical protein
MGSRPTWSDTGHSDAKRLQFKSPGPSHAFDSSLHSRISNPHGWIHKAAITTDVDEPSPVLLDEREESMYNSNIGEKIKFKKIPNAAFRSEFHRRDYTHAGIIDDAYQRMRIVDCICDFFNSGRNGGLVESVHDDWTDRPTVELNIPMLDFPLDMFQLFFIFDRCEDGVSL